MLFGNELSHVAEFVVAAFDEVVDFVAFEFAEVADDPFFDFACGFGMVAMCTAEGFGNDFVDGAKFEIVLSQKGKRQLAHEGYMFRRDKTHKATIGWR